MLTIFLFSALLLTQGMIGCPPQNSAFLLLLLSCMFTIKEMQLGTKYNCLPSTPQKTDGGGECARVCVLEGGIDLWLKTRFLLFMGMEAGIMHTCTRLMSLHSNHLSRVPASLASNATSFVNGVWLHACPCAEDFFFLMATHAMPSPHRMHLSVAYVDCR